MSRLHKDLKTVYARVLITKLCWPCEHHGIVLVGSPNRGRLSEDHCQATRRLDMYKPLSRTFTEPENNATSKTSPRRRSEVPP